VEASDAQLARAAIEGDAPAFGRLVERLRAPLIGYLIGLTGGRDDAEELAQETFLKAWTRLDGLHEPAAVGAWLYRIARNLAMSKVRRPRTVPLAADVAQGEPGEDPRLLSLLAAVARLGESHREVIARKHFAGQSGQAIAQQLGVAEGTVRSRLSRAYEELRELLREEE
jgi:RNA polymerase sigma-70 factor (ECF subfamily)